MWSDPPFEPKKTSQILDPIHGFIDLTPEMKEVIDTVWYQRLRDIKQMGTSYLVFPSAIHTRIEHCLGTAHLARKFASHLRKTQADLEITERDVQNVAMAGLIHDLGHGPHSHMFDRFVVPKLHSSPWSHEDASVMLFNHIADNSGLDLEREDVRRIEDMVQGVRGGPKPFLGEIVANKVNSIDVDKFDYLNRDKHFLGEKGFNSQYDYIRRCSRVIGDSICFERKTAYSLYGLLQERFGLFQRVYTHRVSHALDLMHADALLLANNHYHFETVIHDPEAYTGLTDFIFSEIQHSSLPELRSSQDILKRVKFRRLYKLAGEVHVPEGSVEHWNHLSASEIITSRTTSLRAEDVEVCTINLSWAKDSISRDLLFYRAGVDEKVEVPLESISAVMPQHTSDCIVRVFVKDAAKLEETQAAFKAFLQRDAPNCIDTFPS